MSNQNHKNHARYIPLWHFITPTIMLAIIISSIINLSYAKNEDKFAAALLVALSVVMVIIWFYARNFALRAQDRAIRAEENFRHFLLTGKSHDTRLRMSQVIALRFASDKEMPALAQRAVAENLSSKKIKASILHWRPDYHRV